LGVTKQLLLDVDRGIGTAEQGPIGVPKAVPPHSLQPDLFTRWSQVVFLNGIAVEWAFCIRISE